MLLELILRVQGYTFIFVLIVMFTRGILVVSFMCKRNSTTNNHLRVRFKILAHSATHKHSKTHTHALTHPLTVHPHTALRTVSHTQIDSS
jgi:hypothetical protein